ncbi:unnamed protein product, partial [Scytosiphon promiscuus]
MTSSARPGATPRRRRARRPLPSSSGHSSSTISAVSAGSMETKHDGMGEAGGSSLELEMHMIVFHHGVDEFRKDGGAPQILGPGIDSHVNSSSTKIGNVTRTLQAHDDDEPLAGEEISASGRMALADFLLGTSDVTSPASAAPGRVGSLATVMEEGPLTGALLPPTIASTLLGFFAGGVREQHVVINQVFPESSQVEIAGRHAAANSCCTRYASSTNFVPAGTPRSPSHAAEGSQASSSAEGIVTVQVEPGSSGSSTAGPMLATDRSESSGSEHSSKSEQEQQLTPRKPPALVATGSGSGSGLLIGQGHPTSTRSSVSSPGSNLVGVSIISSTPSTDSFDLSPESSPRKRRSSPMPPLPPVKESSE